MGEAVSRRQIYIGVAGLVLLVIGVAGLWYPVYLNQFDMYGIKVSCGNGFASAVPQNALSDGGNPATRCGTALLVRRAWTIPVVALGWLLLTRFAVAWVHTGQQTSGEASPA
ncbi:hypothetical protein MKUB_09980 [Mycobacterium kubicae]|uniref:Transmembrane protein n=1 Tax=Mycobacterium kubicae TaxID=120959 RepID=A0ABQ1BII8_9MYCO|nr:hypothetical protein GAN18_03845 [Mycobacterium kubicae]GFG63508.1 hypothetical protein MKUB_09980 [Mycobacterium kubicae]